MVKKKVKVVKKTRTQKVRGQTYEEWYNTPDADLGKQRARDYGDTSQLDDMRAYLGHFKPKDIIEPDLSGEWLEKVKKFIIDNHIISTTVGGLAGIGANMIYPGSGAIAGPVLKALLLQMGVGDKRMKNMRTQNGRGVTQSFQLNPIMCSPNSNSYGGIKL
jgi:hypothetical protein